MTIYKYTVTPGTGWTLRLPAEAEFLCVQTQHDQPQMWFLLDPTAEVVDRTFAVYATGERFEACDCYLGTFQLRGGNLVFHLFELL